MSLHLNTSCSSAFLLFNLFKDPTTHFMPSYSVAWSWMETSSHSPLCFLLLGPLTTSLTLLKPFRASSSSFRNMALGFLCAVLWKPTGCLLLPQRTSPPGASLLLLDPPLKTRELLQDDSGRLLPVSSSLHIMSWERLPLRHEMRNLSSEDVPS